MLWCALSSAQCSRLHSRGGAFSAENSGHYKTFRDTVLLFRLRLLAARLLRLLLLPRLLWLGLLL
jgi:hypothetical protein